MPSRKLLQHRSTSTITFSKCYQKKQSLINKNLFSSNFSKTLFTQTKKSFSKKLNEEYLIMYSSINSNKKSQTNKNNDNNDIGLITINNAAKRNAFCFDMTTDLIKMLTKLNQNFQNTNSPKVIILATEGHCFSAGHDLSELLISSAAQRAEIFNKFAELALLLPSLKPIIIAEVQGLATAAGCQLACSCDLIIASSISKFEMPGVKIGLFPQTPAVPLARMIGEKRALQMLLTAEPITSAKALEWGIVNEVVEVSSGLDFELGRQKLREASLSLASKISEFSADTHALGKKSFYEQAREKSVELAYDVAVEAMVRNFEFDSCKEGVKAFLEKKDAESDKKI